MVLVAIATTTITLEKTSLKSEPSVCWMHFGENIRFMFEPMISTYGKHERRMSLKTRKILIQVETPQTIVWRCDQPASNPMPVAERHGFLDQPSRPSLPAEPTRGTRCLDKLRESGRTTVA